MWHTYCTHMKKLSDNYVIYIVRGKMSRLYSGRRPLSNRSTWKRRSLSWPIFCGVLFQRGWEFLLTASYFKFFLRPSSLTDLCLFLGCPGPDCLDLREICLKGFHLFKASLGMLWKNIKLQWFGRRNICNMFIHTDSVSY